MTLKIPQLSLVVLIGPSGSGKSTFARTRFQPTEVLSSDACRGLVSDDENNQAATSDAFSVLHFIAARRLARGKLTVVDATNVQEEAREPLVALAREYHVLPVAIVFDVPERVCQDRNRTRSDRNFGPHVIRQQSSQLRRSIRNLDREGFRHVFVLRTDEDVTGASIERQPLWNDRRSEHGPFDIIGDVHGCGTELETLLGALGYSADGSGTWRHPTGRQAVFLGDLVDRGPRIPDVLRIVMGMAGAGSALCVPGNHDLKLLRALSGRDIKISHGLQDSLDQLENESPEFRQQAATFLDGLVSHYVLDDGRLVVAHAGMKEEMQGRGSGKVRDFALFGETTGETDEFGMAARYNWAAEYRGSAMVVYGHTPVPTPEWLNGTINIDTGCVFGGELTAVRYPEKELVSVRALHEYAVPIRPLVAELTERPLTIQQQLDDVLDLGDVVGKRIISTRLHRTVTIREENAIAALEVMSRFASNPKWLVYLPPTMAPSDTSRQPGLLEHPSEALGYYRANGIQCVVVEEKHMGSRAVVVVCRDDDAAQRRFGVVGEGRGVCLTRTGRRFIDDAVLERDLLSAITDALGQAGFWEEFKTDWVVLDCELMPWSLKALELLRSQYAAVGAAGRTAIPEALKALRQAAAHGVDVDGLLKSFEERGIAVTKFTDAYRRYCWPVRSIQDVRLAPFHIMATEGTVHIDRDHGWHMSTLRQICDQRSDVLFATPYRVVDFNVESEASDAANWWTDLVGRGGEGMVVKPLSFVASNKRGLLQPAVKCRGPEYLRLIYGPDYLAPGNLERLRNRGLSAKRSLALREFALGIEGLERFVAREPLRRVHECVFGVLALESEPVDPRL
jgi:protein phosphatase